MRRHLPSFVLSALALTLSVALTGCSSDDSTTAAAAAAKGAAPTISNLTFKTTTLTAGKLETLQGSCDFADADGDFDGIQGKASIGGTTSQIARTPAATSDKSGAVIIQLQLGASVKGTIDVELWGLDKNGNESNHEKIKFEVK